MSFSEDAFLHELARRGVESLGRADPGLYELIRGEYRRQMEALTLVAASSAADPAVLACCGTVLNNVTTEGYPGARFHGGCAFVDEVERLAVERARAAFGAAYANVQPHSGSAANHIAIFGLLRPGDRILGLDLDSGGHLTHGSRASVVGQYFRTAGYGLDGDGFLDYEAIGRRAREFRPRMIIGGSSAYPRAIDFRRLRAVADEVGAYLLADVSHIAGLVAAGLHASPVDHAHVTTTSTYKQLYGPRGGLILIGRDHDLRLADGRTLADTMQAATFPFYQGTPSLAAVAAKARALAAAATPEFAARMERVLAGAAALAGSLAAAGYELLTGGTDNHMVVLDLERTGLTGVVAERALEECSIVVNRNKVPGDRRGPLVASGLRLGTNHVAARGMGGREAAECAALVDRVLRSTRPSGERSYALDATVREDVRGRVRDLCARFPIPGYPALLDSGGAGECLAARCEAW
jgi:glycine hydroxymethyltransferase